MVHWKGDIDQEECGERASRLDSIDQLDVPNFFVIDRSEIAELLEEFDPLKDDELPEKFSEKMNESYKEVDMSSAVRNSSGTARNLVGSQRKRSKVSVRISSSEKGLYRSELNVGASDLDEALKKVLNSYYRRSDDPPAVIVGLAL